MRNGVRGIKKCPCGVFDVFGWDGVLQDDPFEAGAKLNTYDSLNATMVPSVLGKFSADNRNIYFGQQPPDHYAAWYPVLPALWDNAPGGQDRASDIVGARVVFDIDYPDVVVYFYSAARSTPTDYEGGVSITHIYVFNIETQDQIAAWQASAAQSANSFPFKRSIFHTGGNSATPFATRYGFSRNTACIVTASGVATRLHFDTGDYQHGAVGILPAGALEIILPAQQCEGTDAWVLGWETDEGVWSAKWTNTIAGTDLITPGSAYITESERQVRLDNKPGWPTFSGAPTFEAYTRRSGYDYVLVRDVTDRWYYDGRKAEWYSCANPAAPTNVYATEEGDVVYARSSQMRYVDVDGTQWSLSFIADTVPPLEPVALSASDQWIQIKSTLTGNINSVATADIENTGTTNYNLASANWSVSRRLVGSVPIVIPHRTYDWLNVNLNGVEGTWHEHQYTTIPLYESTSVETPPGHFQLWGNAESTSPSFDAVPHCPCCSGSEPTAAGY